MTVRDNILDEAKALTEGDRNDAYGSPFDGMFRFSNLVWAYMEGRSLRDMDAADGAMILVLLKVARAAHDKTRRDTFADMAAYAAIAYECANDSTNPQSLSGVAAVQAKHRA